MSDNSAAWPLADQNLEQEILDLVQSCRHANQLKKGANEVIKTLNRGVSEFVVLAADTTPLALLLNIPLLCEDKNVPYIFVQSRSHLGRACGLSRSVIAASVTSNTSSECHNTIVQIRAKIERVAI